MNPDDACSQRTPVPLSCLGDPLEIKDLSADETSSQSKGQQFLHYSESHYQSYSHALHDYVLLGHWTFQARGCSEASLGRRLSINRGVGWIADRSGQSQVTRVLLLALHTDQRFAPGPTRQELPLRNEFLKEAALSIRKVFGMQLNTRRLTQPGGQLNPGYRMLSRCSRVVELVIAPHDRPRVLVDRGYTGSS
jgi:hypothetical protein